MSSFMREKEKTLSVLQGQENVGKKNNGFWKTLNNKLFQIKGKRESEENQTKVQSSLKQQNLKPRLFILLHHRLHVNSDAVRLCRRGRTRKGGGKRGGRVVKEEEKEERKGHKKEEGNKKGREARGS